MQRLGGLLVVRRIAAVVGFCWRRAVYWRASCLGLRVAVRVYCQRFVVVQVAFVCWGLVAFGETHCLHFRVAI